MRGIVGVEFRVLGTVQAERDGRKVELGGPRSRAVLAVLLLHAGQVVSREQLIEYAWESTSGRADELVAASVYYLRQALAPDEDQVRVWSVREGFAVQVDPMVVDAHRFLALLGPSDVASAMPESERTARLREALGLWRGETSALVGGRSRWLRGQAQMLEGRRLDAIEELARLHLDAGRVQESTDLLRDIAPVPEREGLTAVMIRSLMVSGQASRAVLMADTAIGALRQQGRAPGVVLRTAAEAALGTRAGDAPHAPRQLPADTTLFTGRNGELERLLALAERAGSGNAPGTVVIFAIDGMGGVGKSALAIRAGHRLAERYPDGQLFLDLHGYTQSSVPRVPGDALATLLSSLGVSPQQIPADVEARAALYRDRLSGTRTLIVLDNAADEAQVRPLLPAAETCLVLITSRTRLKALDDAVPLPVDVLPLGEAAALLRKAARLGEHPQDEPLLAQVAELCGRLPLALLIAAALLRTGGRAWNLNLLIDRLAARRAGHELAGFTDETRNLTTVFDLSYRDLPEDQRLLFRRLALLPGPEVDAYAAAALLDSDRDQADALLQRLADHNLLSGASPGRYRIHDLIRAHARTHNPGRNGALDRLLHYYAHTAKTASLPIARIPRPSPDGPAPAHAPALHDPDIARAWLRTERPNLYAAFTHARAHALNEHIIALAAGLAEILRTDGPWPLALEVHQSAAETAEHLGELSARAAALVDVGSVRRLTGDLPGAADVLTRALEISRAAGNRLNESNALTGLGIVRRLTGDLPGAAVALTRALEISRAAGNRLSEATALAELAQVRHSTGDFPAATGAADRAVEIFREIGNRNGEATAMTSLGRVRALTGDFSWAYETLSQALEIYREIGNRDGQANALNELGRVRERTGDHARATDAANQALEIYRTIGNHLGEANAQITLGRALYLTGDVSGASDGHTRALEIFREIGNRLGEADALTELGRVWLFAGDPPKAADALARALEIYRAIGDHNGEASALNHYAAALAAAGEGPRALALHNEALAMNRRLNKAEDEALSLEGIAEHHLATGNPTQGAAHLNQALEIYQRLGMPPDIERVQVRLAGLTTQ